MAGAFWGIVEDDRQGNPKKVMAEVLGEAGRLAAKAGGQAEAMWLTDKATEAGLKQLGEWGAKRVLLLEQHTQNALKVPNVPKLLGPAPHLEMVGARKRQALNTRVPF